MNKDYRQYPEYNSFYENKGWLVEKIGSSYVLIRRFPMWGSVIKIKRCHPEISLQKLDELSERHHAFFIKLELNLTTDNPRTPKIVESLKTRGYIVSKWQFCPTKTIYINLSLSLDKLLAQTKKDVRRYIRINQEKNFKFRRDKNLEDFYPLLTSVGKLKGYLVPNLKDFKMQWGVYGEDLKLFLGYKDNTLLGGSMTLCRGDYAFGIHMALSDKGIKERFSYSLMWESIKTAKNAGCKYLDLDGIYDSRFRTHTAWKGLSEFKKKFGGKEIEFVGCFIKCRFFIFKIFSKFGLL